jgi:ATP-binding cassette subfamily F protein 3
MTRNIHLDIDIRLPNWIMKIENLKIWYKEELFAINGKLEIRKDDKIWIIWRNWIWKTTLIKTLFSQLQPLWWKIELNEKIRLGSFSQTLEDLNMENTCLDEICWPWISQTQARTILGSLLIIWDKVEQKIKTFSWWEKAKVALTKLILSKPHIIIMDEPTNHLDIYSKQSIQNLIKTFPWPTIIVSHDEDLLMNTSNKLRLITPGNFEKFDIIEQWFEKFKWTLKE